MEPSSSEKNLLKPLKIIIFWSNLCKSGSLWATPKTRKQFFFAEITIPDHNLSKTLSKYHMFWLGYECFSILCDAFLLKSVISNHNSWNDYYTTRLKSCHWVMVAPWYILNTARGMRKLWCLKSDSDISSTSSCDFSWNLAKALALPHVQQRSLNGLVSSMQLKIQMFLGIVLKVDEPVVDEPSSLYRK